MDSQDPCSLTSAPHGVCLKCLILGQFVTYLNKHMAR